MEEVTTPLRRRGDIETYIYTGTHKERERERGETQICSTTYRKGEGSDTITWIPRYHYPKSCWH